MSLSAADWPQFAMQVFGGEMGRTGVVGKSELVPQCSGRATLFASSESFFCATYRLATVHRLQTTDGRTDDKRDR